MRALSLTLAMTMALPAATLAAPAQDAVCEITAGGQRIDGPCRFTPRKGGSFDVSMADERAIGGAGRVSLDLTGKGVGRLTGDGGRDWGRATRQTDGACWGAEAITVCVRAGDKPAGKMAAAKSAAAENPAAAAAVAAKPAAAAATSAGAPSDAERATSFGARCHMGGCNWVIQSPARQIANGSAAVPGRRVQVMQRWASSEHPGDYPDHAPAGLDWSPSEPAQFFCSTKRPAFRGDDGWMVLPLPEVSGASEGISLQYLHACHPGAGTDPYEAFGKLGYKGAAGARDIYPDFAALIAH